MLLIQDFAKFNYKSRKRNTWDTAKGRIMNQYDIALTLNKIFEDIIEMRVKKRMNLFVDFSTVTLKLD